MTEPTRPLADGSVDSGSAGEVAHPDEREVVVVGGTLPETHWAAALGATPGAVTALLASLPGTPADRGCGSAADALPRELVEAAREALAAGGIRLEGPGVGALIPLWREIGGRAPVIVIVLEEPRTVLAAALERPGSAAIALARYEAELRAALEAGKGLAVEIVPAVRILPDDARGAVPAEISALHTLASGLLGRHEHFASPELGRPSAFGAEVLGLAGELERASRAVAFLAGALESVLHIEPERPHISGAAVDKDDVEDGEPNDPGRYPLDASEDRAGFHRWLARRREPIVIGGRDDQPLRRATTRAGRGRPLVSVLVPVYRPPLWALERCVASVLAQERGDWELCLVDDASGDAEITEYLRGLSRADRRIRTERLTANGGISAATNLAFARSTGRYLAFLDHDDELSPDALTKVAAAIDAAPEAELFYSDEDKIDERGERFDPLFKPEWSPDLLLSFAYTCHLTVIRRELLEELGGLRSAFDGSQDYDLALRASERAKKIVHIPELLYHWRSLPASAASGSAAKPYAYTAGRLAVADALERRGEPGRVEEHPDFPGRYEVRREIAGSPLVSVIIPFRDQPALLATCATSLREMAGYDRIELVLVDNNSELPETAALLERLGAEPDVTVVRDSGPFNWAAINNGAARVAKGDVLVFMNNDIEALVPGWLDALLGQAMRPEVGAVGARLVYPDRTIQHAGVVIGLGGIAGHVLRGLPPGRPGYNSMAISTRNCSVVTGACMAVRREVFWSVGGFDESLPVAFNDVDFCLKLREQGHLVVYTPLAELVHHESKSRGHTDDLAENAYIRERWEQALVAGDPYMNVHLSHWRYWCPLTTPQEDYRWKVYLETPALRLDSSSST